MWLGSARALLLRSMFPMLHWPSPVKVWLHFRDCRSSVKRLQCAASSPPTPASHAVLPIWDYWADWSLSSRVCSTVVKKEKHCACMSALLSSPSPPQIMLLIINRMRACSSWKAGSGTSLLNGAAQLGLKLFNRNMKAPSVRGTRLSEVTTLSLPSQHPLPPEQALLPQGQGSALHPGSSTASAPAVSLHPCQLVHPAPMRPFASWDPSSPLPGCVFINPMLKPGLGSLLLSLQSPSYLCSSLPLSWRGPWSFCSCTPRVPHGPSAPSGEAVLSRAQLCSTALWSCCWAGAAAGLHGGREPGSACEVLAAHGHPGQRVKQGQQPGLAGQRNGEVSCVHQPWL